MLRATRATRKQVLSLVVGGSRPQLGGAGCFSLRPGDEEEFSQVREGPGRRHSSLCKGPGVVTGPCGRWCQVWSEWLK